MIHIMCVVEMKFIITLNVLYVFHLFIEISIMLNLASTLEDMIYIFDFYLCTLK